MKKEVKTIVYDEELGIEAYRFEGIVQAFPNHFHEFYVVGLMEGGERCLSCRNVEYLLEKGNMILFNPGDNHACSPRNGSTLDYRAINIPKKVMMMMTEEITGSKELPGFSRNVIVNEEAAYYMKALHEMIMQDSGAFGKEENLLLLLSSLIQNYGKPFSECIPDCRAEIDKACSFMEEHYKEHVMLEMICDYVQLSKSTLLRAFTKSKGVTPYRYLETIRIGEAKKLLEKGISPMVAALETGFSDQSHFTHYFNQFIGLSPGMYQKIFHEKSKGEYDER